MILTIGEMFASPQMPAWIDHISDPNAKGRAQGFMTMAISLGRAVGPLYGGLMIDGGSYKALFASMFGMHDALRSRHLHSRPSFKTSQTTPR